MSDQSNSPLTDEHCECLDRVISRSNQLLTLAQQCKDCGWDVSAPIEALQEQLQRARLTKAKFFPNRP